MNNSTQKKSHLTLKCDLCYEAAHFAIFTLFVLCFHYGATFKCHQITFETVKRNLHLGGEIVMCNVTLLKAEEKK